MAIAYTRLIPETKETSLMSFSARFSELPKSQDFQLSLARAIGGDCEDAGPLPPYRLAVGEHGIEPVGISLEEYLAISPKDRQEQLGSTAIICGIESIRVPINPISGELCQKIGATILDAEQLGLYDLYHNHGYLVNHTTTPPHAHEL